MKKLKTVGKWKLCGEATRQLRRIMRENETGDISGIAVVALQRNGDVLRGMEWKEGQLFQLLGAVSNCLHDLNKEVIGK